MKAAVMYMCCVVLVYSMVAIEADANIRKKRATVNGITALQPVMQVDNNAVVCQAAVSPDNHTYVVLVTAKNAWTKELIVTAPGVFGYQLKCGDKFGSPMSGLNIDMKFNMVDLGYGTGGLAIQFLKAKSLGKMTNYGTMSLPSSVQGYMIVFFWPNDAEGDSWNNFIDILKAAETVTTAVAGIASNVVAIGADATQLLALFM